MRVLFDQGAPAPLRRHSVEHSVHTTFEMGQSNLRNGDLLDRAEEGNYDLFITTDQQLRHQPDAAGRVPRDVYLIRIPTHEHTNW